MVEITSDLAVPSDLNSVQIVVSANGVTQLDQTTALGPGNLSLPATIGVIVGPNADPATPARIDIIGYRSTVNGVALPQVVNEAVVTIPETGIVLLRMPLDYLCLNQFKANPSATDAGSDAGGEGTSAPYVPSCPSGETCVAGACTPDSVPASTLPAYSPSQLFGGGLTADSGTCFDVSTCFATTTTLALPAGSPCTIPLPADVNAADVNVAILTSTDSDGEGVCLEDGDCLVPLDEGSGGFTVSGKTVTLPAAVCSLATKVVVSPSCPSKTAADPLCAGSGGTLNDASTRPHDAGGPDATLVGHDAGVDGMAASTSRASSRSETTSSSGEPTGTTGPSSGSSETAPPSSSTGTSSPSESTSTMPSSSATSSSTFSSSIEPSSSTTTTSNTSTSTLPSSSSASVVTAGGSSSCPHGELRAPGGVCTEM
jgi:hypothetical protein